MKAESGTIQVWLLHKGCGGKLRQATQQEMKKHQFGWHLICTKCHKEVDPEETRTRRA